MTIIPAQSISGTNPDKAFLILKNISNCIIGQSVTGCNMNRLYINNCICIPFQTNKEEQQKQSTDIDKIVEKLQKRIGKEQAEKNETKTQLEQALARIEELEKGGKKSVKEKSYEEKVTELQKAKNDEIASLKAQIKISNITSQADEVLKENGIVLSAAELGLLVDVDEEKTYSNVKTFLNLLDNQRSQWEKARNTGTTPKRVPSNNDVDVFKQAAAKYQ